MKIIGSAGRDEFIVSANATELARIAGFYYGSEKGCPPILIGASIEVSAMYDRLRKLSEAAGQMRRVQQTLRAVADLIEPIPPAIIAAQEVTE